MKIELILWGQYFFSFLKSVCEINTTEYSNQYSCRSLCCSYLILELLSLSRQMRHLINFYMHRGEGIQALFPCMMGQMAEDGWFFKNTFLVLHVIDFHAKKLSCWCVCMWVSNMFSLSLFLFFFPFPASYENDSSDASHVPGEWLVRVWEASF